MLLLPLFGSWNNAVAPALSTCYILLSNTVLLWKKKKNTLNCSQTLVQEEGIWRVKPSLESVYLWSSVITSWADNSALGKMLQRKGVRRRVRLSSLLVKQGVCLWESWMQLGEVDLGDRIGEEEEAWMSLWKRVLCERVEKLFKAIFDFELCWYQREKKTLVGVPLIVIHIYYSLSALVSNFTKIKKNVKV